MHSRGSSRCRRPERAPRTAPHEPPADAPTERAGREPAAPTCYRIRDGGLHAHAATRTGRVLIRRLEDRLAGGLAAWTRWVDRHAGKVALALLGTTLGLGVFAALELGVNTDNKRLLSEDLGFQRASREFRAHFPTLDDALLVVVDAPTASEASEAARALAAELAGRPERFTDVFVPGGGAFFERHGLLYREVEELEEFVDQIARLQPVLAELSRDPSVAGLTRLIRLGLEQSERDGSSPAELPDVLDQFGRATVAVYQEHPLSVSWEQLLLEGSAFDSGARRVVVVEPVLDFERILAAARPIAEIRSVARELGLGPERGISVRITGNPALNQEEMLGLVWDVGVAGVLCFAFVVAILQLAFRSLRLVLAAVVTLASGLVWTAAFATASVGELNLISVTFGVLFIGLGIDFSIHLGMHYAHDVSRGRPHRNALEKSVRRMGRQLVICSLTTAIGFYAFLPTDYRGIAELGLIAGTGMFVILFLTFTLFPALIGSVLRLDETKPLPPPRTPPTTRVFERHPRATVLGAGALAALCLLALPRVRFDAHVVDLRDPDTESVQAFQDLLAESATSPWYVDVLAPDLASARELAGRLEALPEVEHAVTLADYVPADQGEKLEILADASLMLGVADAGDPREAPSTQQQIEALRRLHDFLGRSRAADHPGRLASSARLLHRELGLFLERVGRDERPDLALASLESILLGELPSQLGRLRTALATPPIRRADLPDDLVARMLAPDGRARVQVFPREDLDDDVALEGFVDAVRTVAPQATGVAVHLVEFGRATVRSLRQAMLGALAAIALLLVVLWRRPADAALVVGLLLLAALLTIGSLGVLDLPFNFANVIVLPLLLGIGVDSGVHLVERARAPLAAHRPLAETTTGRAVFYSAMTTIASFGSLALSSHRGIASLGYLLVIGMGMTLLCNLVILPAWLRLRHSREND